MKRILQPVFLAVLLFPLAAGGVGHRGHGARNVAPAQRRAPATTGGVDHRGHGEHKRDPEQRAKFMRSHPCPSTGRTSGACPGYVVDHVRPLKRGGRDDPSNMQWQTTEEGERKDRSE